MKDRFANHFFENSGESSVSPTETPVNTGGSTEDLDPALRQDATKEVLDFLEDPRETPPERPKFNPDWDDPKPETDREINLDDIDEELNDDLGDGLSDIPDFMIEATVNFGVDQMDLYLPKLIAFLNDLEDLDEFRASKEEIKNIKKHATIVFKEKKVGGLTSSQQLLLTIGFAYGFPLIKGILKKSPEILGYISRGFKKAAKKTGTPHIHNIDPLEEYVNCMDPNCGESFRKGEGFPKTSKHHPELIGKFCGSGHYTSYTNRKGITGRKPQGNG